MVDTRNITVSVIQANNGKVTVHHSYHALGRVLRDAGFRFPPLIDKIPDGQRIDVSAEQLPELDADFVFATWRSDTGGKPQEELPGSGRGDARLVRLYACLPHRSLYPAAA